MIEVRWFAGAADAAGRATAVVDAAPGASASAVLTVAAAGNARLERVHAVCSVLLDGATHRDLDSALPPGDHVLDVLPPFAGG